MIERFVFTVEPWVYANPGGGELAELRITVRYGNRDYGMTRIFPHPPPFETAIHYYARMAVQALEAAMKQEADNNGSLASVGEPGGHVDDFGSV